MAKLKNLLQYLSVELFQFLQRQDHYWKYKEWVRRGVLEIGRHTYGSPIIHSYRGNERKVVIGSYCSIGPNVTIITGGAHPTDWVSTYPFRAQWNLPGAYQDGMPVSRGDVVIGSDVWISSNIIILSGVTIGHGAVIAAGSLVTRDIPPYSIAGGVPARVLRHRFSAEQIAKLLEIQWWRWDEKKIERFVPLLSSNQIDDFIQAALLEPGITSRHGSRSKDSKHPKPEAHK
jgi:acetyltransferase-like isoleucine patch superfamily enzyme